MLRERAAGLPLQVLRPSIIVGDSRTGRTSTFNVLYGPLKALARGGIPAIPARRSSPVDIVPVDYVADRAVELATSGPDGTFHLVAGSNATTVDRILELTALHLRQKPPAVLPPRVYGLLVHPWMRRRNPGLRSMEVYFPYFSMRVRFDDRGLGPGPPVEDYFGRLIDFAEEAGWVGAYPPLCDSEARGADREPLRGALGADVGPGGDRRPAPLRRGRALLQPARDGARARRRVAPRDRRRRGRARAARRGRRRPGGARDAPRAPRTGSPSSRRRSGWRWSSPIPTTTRT